MTGGKDRIQQGIGLLKCYPKTPLLITGVHAKYLKEVDGFPQYKDHIDLGFKATTTRENAEEIGKWNQVKLCKSLIIVTSHYHMPRSLLEIKNALPDVELIPYPVVSRAFQNGQWLSETDLIFLLMKEYTKYVIVLLETKIGMPFL